MKLLKFIIIFTISLMNSYQTIADIERKEISNLDPNELKALEYAFSKMIERNKAPEGMNEKEYKNSNEYRRSLAFWSDSHNIITRDSILDIVDGILRCRKLVNDKIKASEIDNNKKHTYLQDCDKFLKFSIDNLATNDYLDNKIKSTEYSKLLGRCPHGTPEFLLWHRLYMGSFEKALLRNIKDNEEFENIEIKLPYWDYTNNSITKNKEEAFLIPKEFRNPESSLYQELRTSGLNDTDDKKANAIKKFVVNFDVNKYTELNYSEFNSRIEIQPHNVIHCAVGYECTIGMMGLTETAGYDPLFYSHHMNIERLFQEWLDLKFQENNAGQPTQNLTWAKKVLGINTKILDTEYSFINETGDKVLTYKLADAFDLDKFPRSYPKYNPEPNNYETSYGNKKHKTKQTVNTKVDEIGTYPYEPNEQMDSSDQYVSINHEHKSSSSFTISLTKKDNPTDELVIGVISAFGLQVEDVIKDGKTSNPNSHSLSHSHSHSNSNSILDLISNLINKICNLFFDCPPKNSIKYKLPEGKYLKDYDTIKIQRVSLTHDVHYPKDQPTIGLPLIKSITLHY